MNVELSTQYKWVNVLVCICNVPKLYAMIRNVRYCTLCHVNSVWPSSLIRVFVIRLKRFWTLVLFREKFVVTLLGKGECHHENIPI